jgi:hypothetical protein
MQIDKFEIWELIKEVPSDLYFYGLEHSSDSLVVLLKSLKIENGILKITFNGVLTYRVSQETARSKTLYENASLREFRVANNSEFMRWFQEESSGIFEGWDLKHYYICNIDNIIDVISGPPVKVEWVSE